MAEFGVDTYALRAAAVQVGLLTVGVDAAAAVPARLLRVAEQVSDARCGPLVEQLAGVVAAALAGLSTALVGLRQGLADAAETYEVAEAAATVHAEPSR